MKKTISDIAQLLKSSKEEKKDSMFYAKVNSLITEGGEVKGYKVSLDGTANDTIEAKKIAGAKVGDVVQVNLHNGHASVTGTVGGDTDAKAAQETAEVADGKADAAQETAEVADGKADAAQETAEVADGKATTAQERADSAYEEAQTAIQSADSKSTVYHQPSQPSGGTYKTGDTWFDTDDGYKMYTYNGSSWVAEQFNTNAIANSCITNAKIADATIQNAKIATLDAGKITTGTLDANRIAANSLTIGKMASDVTTSISNASTAYQQCVVIDGNGVKVRNSSYPNNAIRMASDGIEFYKDGQSVAYYTDASIELGKNSTSSVVKMSNNAVRIQAYNSTSAQGSITSDDLLRLTTNPLSSGGTVQSSAQVVVNRDSSYGSSAFVQLTANNAKGTVSGNLKVNEDGSIKANNKEVVTYDKFSVTSVSWTTTQKSSGENLELSPQSATNSGYYPLGIVGVKSTAYRVNVNCYLSAQSSGAATVGVSGCAAGGAVASGQTISAYILWVKM